MENYFASQNVNWNRFSPKDVIFKSNSLTKKLLPEENLLSYKTKTDRDNQMHKLTGGTRYTNSHGDFWYGYDKYKAVHVHLKDLKTSFPTACVDFVDFVTINNSVGKPIPRLDALVYIQSFHREWSWQQDAQGNYQKVYDSKECGADEGYLVAFGGQGEGNPMSVSNFKEIVEISEAIKNFLVERVVAHKQGTYQEKGVASCTDDVAIVI